MAQNRGWAIGEMQRDTSSNIPYVLALKSVEISHGPLVFATIFFVLVSAAVKPK